MSSRKLVILLLHSVSFFLYKGTVPIKVTKAIHTVLKWSKHNAFWVNLGEQLTVPVCESTRILVRRPNGTEFITGRARQLSDKTTRRPTAAQRILNFVQFVPLPHGPYHLASRKSKPDSLRRSMPNMVMIACL